MDVFRFDDYKDCLRAFVAESEKRGAQSSLAGAAGCQRAYISQVLNGPVHLTLDQGAGISVFWRCTEIEADYFLELINYARAGTEALRQVSRRRQRDLRRRNADLSKKFAKATSDEGELTHRYYSSWHYIAIHVLVSIPSVRTPEKIAARLAMPVPMVETALRDLQQMGVVGKTKN